MVVIINGAEIYTKQDFHKQVAMLLNFPHYYGENLDALWDCLFDICPVDIRWEQFNLSKERLGDYANKARSVFENTNKCHLAITFTCIE